MSKTPEEAQELNYQYEEALRKIYPSFKFGTNSVSSIGGIARDQQVDFSIRQDFLKETSYDCLSQKEFIHYTSLESLYGILNSGEIRLYDLNNMNDPYEFNYLIKKFKLDLNKKQIDFFKRSLFITSLCGFKGEDSFDLWRLYGKDGRGVAIVFEIRNPEDIWRNVLLGKVIYGTSNDASEQLKQAIELTNSFVKEKGMNLGRLPMLLGLLLLHHKNSIWGIEEEYRLSTVATYYDESGIRPDRNFLSPYSGTTGYFLNSSGKRLSFISLPLESKIREDLGKDYKRDEIDILLKVYPQIRIKKIIAGYALDKEFVDKLKKFVFEFYYSKWNSTVHVETSGLYENFNE